MGAADRETVNEARPIHGSAEPAEAIYEAETHYLSPDSDSQPRRLRKKKQANKGGQPFKQAHPASKGGGKSDVNP